MAILLYLVFLLKAYLLLSLSIAISINSVSSDFLVLLSICQGTTQTKVATMPYVLAWGNKTLIDKLTIHNYRVKQKQPTYYTIQYKMPMGYHSLLKSKGFPQS